VEAVYETFHVNTPRISSCKNRLPTHILELPTVCLAESEVNLLPQHQSQVKGQLRQKLLQLQSASLTKWYLNILLHCQEGTTALLNS